MRIMATTAVTSLKSASSAVIGRSLLKKAYEAPHLRFPGRSRQTQL